MRTVKYFMMAVLTTGLVAGLGMFRAADDKPKYNIEEIMETSPQSPQGQTEPVQAGSRRQSQRRAKEAIAGVLSGFGQE